MLLPFIKDGSKAGDKAVHVLKRHQRKDHLRQLVRAGMDPSAAPQSGRPELLTNTEVYPADRRFDQDRMAGGNAQGGFLPSRICWRMDWAVEDQPHVDDVIEFEARVNEGWRHHGDAVIRAYHARQFGGDAVIDIMRTHPSVIPGGILQRNPFFVRRDEFLQEFCRRRADRSGSSTSV